MVPSSFLTNSYLPEKYLMPFKYPASRYGAIPEGATINLRIVNIQLTRDITAYDCYTCKYSACVRSCLPSSPAACMTDA
jgi:hypothetical protein